MNSKVAAGLCRVQTSKCSRMQYASTALLGTQNFLAAQKWTYGLDRLKNFSTYKNKQEEENVNTTIHYIVLIFT